MNELQIAPEAVEIPLDLTLEHAGFEAFLTDIRRHLHRHPEIGLHEYDTARFIRDLFERRGLEVVGPLARTGLYVDIVGAADGPTVAYRADIDALPIDDRKDVEYRSTREGLAHLCGHDAHTTIAIGTALLLAERRDRLKGTVRVFFQPNEEGIPSGAPLMIRDGVLEGVSAAFASHVDPTLPTGVFGLITGAATASADRFRVIVRGPSTGHSARPHQSADTVWIATNVMNTLYQVVGRRTDARHGTVLAVCRLRGGDAYNVIPQEVEFGGTVRCTAREDRDTVRTLIAETAQRTAAQFGAETVVDFDHGAPPVLNDHKLVGLVRETITGMFGEDAIFDIPAPSMGAEDFAHYLTHVPGMLLRVGTSDGPATSYPLHDSCFDIDEAVFGKAPRMLAAMLEAYLERAR
ncbi:MAG: amidohydrolase [Rhodothermales bacterium]|nr:amidohydrolase [Rhodothermales bacterium]MBO6781225.1 amidohydrolase [Rhodothermales bacterium]